jgi:O-antigen ligase
MGGITYRAVLPGTFMLTLAAVIVLAVVRPVGLTAWQRNLTILFAAWIGLHFVIPLLKTLPGTPARMSEFTHVIAMIGYVAVPMAVAVALRRSPRLLDRAVWPLAVMWLLNVVYTLMHRSIGYEAIGITGNRNWFAATLLATAPWAAWAVYRSLRKQQRRTRVAAAILVTAPMTIWMLLLASSRASWLALAVFVGLCLLWRLKDRRHQMGYCVACVVGLAAAAVVLKERLAAIQAVDVRLPLYRGTLQLIADVPLFGVGPGQYVTSISSYLVGTGYHERIFAAEQGLHPHNELLNIAVGAGILPALIYAILLLALLRNPLADATASRLAQFSAVILVCQSMLDKPFVQAPSSLLVLFFIGACWMHFVPDTKVIEYKGASRILLLGTALVFAVGGIRAAAFDARWGFHLGCAEVLSGRGEPRAAVAHYERMTRMAPGRIRGPYGAGALYIQKLVQPDNAMPFLEKAYQLDPSYARVNGMIGECYGVAGRHEDALPYFKRQAELYPYRAGPLHAYYLALYYSGREGELAAVNARAARLYLHRPERRLKRDGFAQAVRGWESAVTADKTPQAIAIAGVLTQDLEGRQIDPTLNRALAPIELPGALVWAHFNRADVDYWRLQLWRKATVSQIGGDIDDLVSAVHERVRGDTELPFSLPQTTWEQGRGSPRSIAVLTAFLCQLRWPTVLLEQDGDLVVLVKADSVRAVTAGGAIEEFPASPVNGAIRHLQFPQQFQLKNQMIGVHADSVLDAAPFGFSHMPFLKMTEDTREFGVIYSQGESMRVVRDVCEDYLQRYTVKKEEPEHE